MGMTWGSVLMRIMYRCNVSNAELSRHLKVSPQYVHQILNGNDKPPKMTRLKQIYEYLDSKKKLTEKEKEAFFMSAMFETINQEDLTLVFYIFFVLKIKVEGYL